MRREIALNEIPGLTIDYDGDLSIVMKNLLLKHGAKLYPQLIPGSSIGTIWEDNPDVAELKRNPTKANWEVFLEKHGWDELSGRLVHIPNSSWEETYAMANRQIRFVPIQYSFS